jgi:hypothetical protein
MCLQALINVKYTAVLKGVYGMWVVLFCIFVWHVSMSQQLLTCGKHLQYMHYSSFFSSLLAGNIFCTAVFIN